MLFKKDILDQIAAKRVTVAFRRWRKPSVKAGDSLTTAVGDLLVATVDRVAIAKIPDIDLKRAGYPTRAALLKELAKHPGGDVYRIALRLKPAKVEPPKVVVATSAPEAAPPPAPMAPPRIEPRQPMLALKIAPRTEQRPSPPARDNGRITKAEVRSTIAALRNLDQASGHGAWTITTLRLIDKYPARRPPDLAAAQRRDPLLFKREVLRLKQLGLTENLEIGYRLSPRGRAILAEIIGG